MKEKGASERERGFGSSGPAQFRTLRGRGSCRGCRTGGETVEEYSSGVTAVCWQRYEREAAMRRRERGGGELVSQVGEHPCL